MRPRLVVTRGNDRGREYELRRAETQVGRGRANHIVLTDPSVSRHHLSIFVDGDEVLARDEGSGNGTLRNGARIAGEVELVDGDELEVGDTVLKLLAPAPRVITEEPVRVPVVRERPPRRDLKPLLLGGGAVIALGALVILVAALVSGGRSAPPPRPAEPALAVAPPPVVISALPEEAAAPAATPAPEPPPKKPRRSAAPRGSTTARDAAAAYARKDFAEAARILRDGDDDEAAELAKDYAIVGAALARGDASADAAPTASLAAYQDALAADARSGDGEHANYLRARIARVAPAAAAAYLDAGRLEQARAACDLAVNFGTGGDDRVTRTRDKLEQAAAELYARAQALAARDADEARLLYRRVVRIVPAESAWSKKALAAARDL